MRSGRSKRGATKKPSRDHRRSRSMSLGSMRSPRTVYCAVMMSEEEVRGLGAIAPGCYRVVVHEPDGRLTYRDFDSRADAEAYADDVAREAVLDDGSYALADVFDAAFRAVHRAGTLS